MDPQNFYGGYIDPFGGDRLSKAEVQSLVEMGVAGALERRSYRGTFERAGGFRNVPADGIVDVEALRDVVPEIDESTERAHGLEKRAKSGPLSGHKTFTALKQALDSDQLAKVEEALKSKPPFTAEAFGSGKLYVQFKDGHVFGFTSDARERF
jgi:hypothetical protein